ncbi:MAG TPA: serine/threonine-protein kinase [Polyangiaceae bacterium]|nr:serine/threonine-protein kinase [Polyangiaceae bacterium]
MPARGDLLGDRYRLTAPLAEGGMGTVWRAHHTELDVDVAVKVMSAASAAAAAGEKRFRREAQASARLRSPHIVQVLDYGMFQGQPYLVMELLEGEDLETRLAREETLPIEQCGAIIDAVAKALELAHGHGIIHRDLKPSNIFLARVGEEEIAKVLDFGVAKDLRSGNKTTGAEVIGSPPYMSPEQVWGEALTPKSDLWSLGVVALEMLTGKNPFADDALAKVFDHIIRDDLPRLGDLKPELAPRFEAFFERALARDPEDRFPSANALAEAFRTASAPEKNDALAPTVAVDAQPRAPTWGRTAAAIFGTLVVVAAIAFFATNREGTAATTEPSAPKTLEPPHSAPAAAPTPPPAPSSAAPVSSQPKPPQNPKSSPRPKSSVDDFFGIPR